MSKALIEDCQLFREFSRATVTVVRVFPNLVNRSHRDLLFVSEKLIYINRGRYPVLGHPLPWAISFFLNEKKINIFRLMHIHIKKFIFYTVFLGKLLFASVLLKQKG